MIVTLERYRKHKPKEIVLLNVRSSRGAKTRLDIPERQDDTKECQKHTPRDPWGWLETAEELGVKAGDHCDKAE